MRALSAYLAELGRNRKETLDWTDTLWLPALLLFFVIRDDVGLLLAIIFSIAAYSIAMTAVGSVRAKNKRSAPADEVLRLVDELVDFEKAGTLRERTHPGHIELVERIAVVHEELCRLEANASKETKDLYAKSRRTVEEALHDALWLGRHLVRRKQQRQTTYDRKRQNPNWGSSELAQVESLVADVERLLLVARPDGLEFSDLRSRLEDAIVTLEEREAAIKELTA
ncbi:MAG TPA: hypothetical protein PKA27_07990 [Fimbriimonadaceae bacterium]|mgnify:CR=1 FL=1|nr:hypothetical protein [Fimbriimonadaceae bacterium]